MITETDTQKIVIKLLDKLRPEELAVKCDRSVATINLWKAGKRCASKGDYMLLEHIARRL